MDKVTLNSNNNNDNQSAKDDAMGKPGFLSAFWESCLNLTFYAKASRASWWHAGFHAFILILLIAIACSVATYLSLESGLGKMLSALPVVVVKDGKATFDDKLKLPWRKSFPDKGPRRLHYIIDSGEHVNELEQTYSIYVIFTPAELIVNDGKFRQSISMKQIERDPSMKNVFGNPVTFSSGTLASFTASVASIAMGVLFFVILLVFFPLSSIMASLIASVADKWNFSFSQIVKLSFFAATPGAVILIFACFWLTGSNLLLILAGISWIIQVAYLTTGLKACKQILETDNL